MKRIGILGTGSIARWHARCWQRLPVEMVGYFDLNQAAAQGFAEQYGGTAFPTLDEFLDQVDLVDVCTPGTAHTECVVAAAEAGKAVTCEKPLARHLNECTTMIDACEKAGVPLFIAHVVRFFPQFAGAKASIDSGAIGNPGVIRTVRNGSFPGGNGNTYYGDFRKSGGVIMDVGIHDIDFHRWCCGEVERVFARGLSHAGIDDRDHALMVLRFESGAIGHIECSWAHPPGQFRTRLEIAGDEGLIEWDSADRQAIVSAFRLEDDPKAPVPRNGESPTSLDDDPYLKELAHFLDHVENGTPLLVTPHDAYMAVKVSLAAIESVRIGQPVDIASFEENFGEHLQ
ncbi:MAG: Gfo/Idh/MocA family oxidoreductase [Chloroflexota bacterium]